MTKYVGFLIALLFFTISGHTQDKCSRFYPISEKATYTTAVYGNESDARNNLSKLGEVTYSVDEVLQNAALYSVTVSMDPMPIQKAQYKVTCSEGGVSIDPKGMAAGMMSRFSDAEITGDNIYLPNDLDGPYPKSIDDAEMKINYTTAGRTMTMERNRINRKITGQEEIVTPARAAPFKCYVLEYEVDMRLNGNTIMTTKTREWLADGFGVVQSQELDATGIETSFSWLVNYVR